MTDLNKEREAFEQHLIDIGLVEFAGYGFDVNECDEYTHEPTNVAWGAWVIGLNRAKAQAVPEKKIYLTCEQLYAAANFGAPNKDPELLETELTIAWFDEAHSGSGYYVYISEYPEEGAMKLESESGAEK